MSSVITIAQIAKPSINDVFKRFLEVQSKRLAPKTARKYGDVIDLLQSHLDNYGHDGLLTAERSLFEKHYTQIRSLKSK